MDKFCATATDVFCAAEGDGRRQTAELTVAERAAEAERAETGEGVVPMTELSAARLRDALSSYSRTTRKAGRVRERFGEWRVSGL